MPSLWPGAQPIPEAQDSQNHAAWFRKPTKSTIHAILEESAPHWNAQELQAPSTPVTRFGLASQIDLDIEVHRARKENPIDI